MTQKAYLKLEKKLAQDLRPGEVFVLDHIPPSEMNGVSPVLQAFIRTNTSVDDFTDIDTVVYKVHIVLTDPEEPAPPRVNPHAPPGMKNDD